MRFNPLAPSLPNYPGPFKVGTIQVELPLPKELHRTFGNATVRTLLVRLFYPTSATHGPRPKWTGHGNYAVKGYAHFLGISESLLNAASYFGLKWTEIPAFTDSPLLKASELIDAHPSPSNKWPAMIFSHGLGGTRNAYSQISGSIASGGIVVMSLEHRDNSAAISVITEGEDVEVVEYISIKDSTPENIQKRRHQISQRAYEVKLGIELFRAMNGDRSIFSGLDDKLSQFKSTLDCAKGNLLMAGHSFGAATAVNCAKDSSTRIESDSKDYTLKSEFRALVLLDPWMEVLVDSTATKLTVPAVAIASEAFMKWSSNWRSVIELLSHDESSTLKNKLCHVKESAHLQQSDFALLFPTATKYAFKAGCSPHLAMDLNVRLVREFLRTTVGMNTPADEAIYSHEGLVMFK